MQLRVLHSYHLACIRDACFCCLWQRLGCDSLCNAGRLQPCSAVRAALQYCVIFVSNNLSCGTDRCVRTGPCSGGRNAIVNPGADSAQDAAFATTGAGHGWRGWPREYVAVWVRYT